MSTSRITHDEHPPLPNGRLGKHAATRANGHAKESAPPANAPQDSATQARARAAADDARGTPDAPASAPPAASANRAGDAAAARDSKHDAGEETASTRRGERSRKSGARNHARTSASREAREQHVPVPPGELPLPEGGAAFVNAAHEKADLIEIGRRLLNSEDEKVVKGTWDRLVNLKFGNTDEQTDEEPRRVIVGMPRPIRHIAPEAPEQAT